jgi:uncharacterized membrane protein
MEKLRALWHDVTDSLWFLPGLLTLAGGALAVLLVKYNDAILGDIAADDVWWVFGGTSGGAMSVLEAIAGSIITVTGVVFSVTIIALQLASSQFTPRVLRQFMADRSNQLVLGVFIATFTYALIVLRTVRSGDENEFVPAVAVTAAVLLALTSIGFLIYFIDHVARSIQAAVIIDSVTTSTLGVVGVVYPDTVPDCDDPERPFADELTPGDDVDAYEVRATKAGYVQAIDRRRLAGMAREHDLLIRMEIEIGAYLLPGQVVMRAWPGTSVNAGVSDELFDGVVLGLERTPHQDVKHGIIEIMDIAVKGMSPSVNDPTTAANSIQRLGEVLLDVAWRQGGDSVERDDDGRLRLIIRRPRLDDTVDLAFNQIRHYSSANASVMITLINTLAELSALSPHAVRPAFTSQLEAAIRTARSSITDPTDRDRLEKAAAAATERARAEPPRQRPQRQ